MRSIHYTLQFLFIIQNQIKFIKIIMIEIHSVIAGTLSS